MKAQGFSVSLAFVSFEKPKIEFGSVKNPELYRFWGRLNRWVSVFDAFAVDDVLIFRATETNCGILINLFSIYEIPYNMKYVSSQELKKAFEIGFDSLKFN